ncbi:unnamed protein product [Auanema sp. JU1783]|nr:unnamed protein product [Auanema sp. JU1783]
MLSLRYTFQLVYLSCLMTHQVAVKTNEIFFESEAMHSAMAIYATMMIFVAIGCTITLLVCLVMMHLSEIALTRRRRYTNCLCRFIFYTE